jgi:hypothetical protein
MQRYLCALLRNPDDAEEVLQDFLLRVVRHGFVRARQERGRFRDYLKVAIRNAALNHLRRRRPSVPAGDGIAWVPTLDDAETVAEREWVAQWRRCLLDRAWRALERRQRLARGSLAYITLRLSVDHPEEDSPGLADRVRALTGKRLRADAFRKQVSRARRQFAACLVYEVAQTLDHPSLARIVDELIDLGLMEHVRPHLPADWRTPGAPPAAV